MRLRKSVGGGPALRHGRDLRCWEAMSSLCLAMTRASCVTTHVPEMVSIRPRAARRGRQGGSMDVPRLTELAHGGGCGCKLAPPCCRRSSRTRRRCGTSPNCWSAPRPATTRRSGGSTTSRRSSRPPTSSCRGGRPVRLRPHRRDQRALRRLCDGRYADLRPRDRGHAGRQAAGRGDAAHPGRRRGGLRRGGHPGCGRPLDRHAGADLRPRRARAWCIPTGAAQQPARGRATG